MVAQEAFYDFKFTKFLFSCVCLFFYERQCLTKLGHYRNNIQGDLRNFTGVSLIEIEDYVMRVVLDKDINY